MKRILALLFLGTLFFTSCSHGFLRGPASADERLGVRGLESLPLDQWTQGFFDGNRARPGKKLRDWPRNLPASTAPALAWMIFMQK